MWEKAIDTHGNFQWNLFPGQTRRCWQCGKEPLKRDDVGEHRTLYPFRVTEFLCKECQRENIHARLEARKAQKGS